MAADREARRIVARWHLLRGREDAESASRVGCVDLVRALADQALDVVMDAGKELSRAHAHIAASRDDVEEAVRREVWGKAAREAQQEARDAMASALTTLRDLEGDEAKTPWGRIMGKARRRADAVLECGRSSCATSLSTGAVLRDVEGKPSWRRQSCNDRFCKACQKRISSERASYYDFIFGGLMRDPTLSDGRLRQVVFSRQSSSDIPLSEQVDELWRCFRKFRKLSGLCKNAIAVLEVTYNKEQDWWHPHLHVMTLETEKIDREQGLAAWQYICGYDVGGGLGGFYVNHKKSTKEAMKYVTKGLGMSPFPDARALELLRLVDGMHTVRTYGAVRKSAEETPEPALSDVDVDDALLTDPTTGEVYATSDKVAQASGARLCSWTKARDIVEAARELAWVLWPLQPDKERLKRRRRLALERSRWKRWKRSTAGKRQREAQWQM